MTIFPVEIPKSFIPVRSKTYNLSQITCTNYRLEVRISMLGVLMFARSENMFFIAAHNGLFPVFPLSKPREPKSRKRDWKNWIKKQQIFSNFCMEGIAVSAVIASFEIKQSFWNSYFQPDRFWRAVKFFFYIEPNMFRSCCVSVSLFSVHRCDGPSKASVRVTFRCVSS
jgi:hypothetical protein